MHSASRKQSATSVPARPQKSRGHKGSAKTGKGSKNVFAAAADFVELLDKDDQDAVSAKRSSESARHDSSAELGASQAGQAWPGQRHQHL